MNKKQDCKLLEHNQIGIGTVKQVPCVSGYTHIYKGRSVESTIAMIVSLTRDKPTTTAIFLVLVSNRIQRHAMKARSHIH